VPVRSGPLAVLRLLSASGLTATVGAVAFDAVLAGPGPRAALSLPADRLALRVLLLAVTACSAVLTTGGVLGAIAVTCRSARAWAHAERLTAGLAGRVASIAVVASIAATSQPAFASVAPDEPPTLRLLDDGPAGRSTDHDAPVLRLLDEEDGPALPHDPTGRPPTIGQPSDPTSLDQAGTGSGTSSPVTPGPAVSPGIGDAAAVATGPSRHRVEYGDNLWSIAEAVVTAHDGGEPDQRAIADYWVRLIERNRAGLADPDNPDLLFCGQLLELPDR